MKKMKACLAAGLALAMMASATPAVMSAEEQEESSVRERMGLSYTYPTAYEDWEDGFMGGNGIMGVIVFGNPLNDTVVYNHRLFNIAATRSRSFNTVSEENIKKIREACASGDYKTANDLANATHGWQDGGEGNKHPGYEMKITIPESGEVSGYSRTCDYRTGEIDVNWTDARGDWTRSTFVSRQDNVVVQRLQKPSNGKLDCSVELTTDTGMHLPAGMKFTNVSSEEFLCLRAVYPQPAQTGNAGYEGVTRVIVKGDGAKTELNGNVLSVSGADEVLLLTRVERYNSDCTTEWEKGLVQADLAKLSTDYDTLLAGQIATHGEIYDRVTLDLNASAEDRAKSNEALLEEQKGKSSLLPALYERLFDAGRYHYLCSAGDLGSPDLLGIWTGDCDVGWGGYYHLDANLNLQISGAIVGNMLETMEGYFYLNEAWADDFRTNATKLLGCRGLLAGGNTPGASSGLISALNYYYPYHYVTGEEAWLLYPFWEYYQATGDVDFVRERLYPLLSELGLFYEDFLVEKDEDGNFIFAGSISPENQPAGLGMSLVNNSEFDISGARFALTTLLEVCDMLDVEQGEGEGVERWSYILDHLPDYRINEDGALAEWAWDGLKDNYNHRHSSGLIGVFPYRAITPEETPEVYEAAKTTLSKKDAYNYENAGHGLLHAALIAANLKEANSVTQKLLRLGKEDFYFNGLTTAHYPNNNVFCTDVCNTVPTILMEMLVSSDENTLEFLPALPTTLTKGSINGMLGRNQITVNQMAWDMDTGKIHCQLTSDIDQTITLIERQGITAIETTAVVAESSLGTIAREVTLKAGETVDITLTLDEKAILKNVAPNAKVSASSYEHNNATYAPAMATDGDPTTRWASEAEDGEWIELDLGAQYDVQGITLYWEAAYAPDYMILASDDGENWRQVYIASNAKGGKEELPLTFTARYINLSGLTRVEINGQKYGISLYELEVYGTATKTNEPDDPDDPDKDLVGDADHSGEVDSSDARLVLQYAVKKIDNTALDMDAADVNDDQTIDSADARMILQYAVGKDVPGWKE